MNPSIRAARARHGPNAHLPAVFEADDAGGAGLTPPRAAARRASRARGLRPHIQSFHRSKSSYGSFRQSPGGGSSGSGAAADKPKEE